jgi:hypothetical protein
VRLRVDRVDEEHHIDWIETQRRKIAWRSAISSIWRSRSMCDAADGVPDLSRTTWRRAAFLDTPGRHL